MLRGRLLILVKVKISNLVVIKAPHQMGFQLGSFAFGLMMDLSTRLGNFKGNIIPKKACV
jgi:hypothetical protein